VIWLDDMDTTLRWTDGIDCLNALVKCLRSLPNLKVLQFTARGSKFFSSIWNILNNLPNLKELDLLLKGDALAAFSKITPFPSSVRILRVNIDYCRPEEGTNFVDMIYARAPGLVQLYVESPWFYRILDLGSRPLLRGKIFGASVSSQELDLVPGSVVKLTVYGGLSKGRWNELRDLTHLTLINTDTKELLHLAGASPKLKHLFMLCPDFDLPRDQFEQASDAICRPEVKVVFQMASSLYRSAAKRYWKARLGIDFIDGGN